MVKTINLLLALVLSCAIPAQAQTAMDIAPEMVPGWNLGNTLEAGPCTWLSNDVAWETGWQSTKTSQKIIDYVKSLGFRSVRIPCAWFMHMDNNYKIKSAWMRRVKEVVDYCIKDSLYVMLNGHWDNGWIEVDGFKDISEENVQNKCEILETMWTQIATEFADYDHHLLFAGLNEPNADTNAKAAVLKRYNQTFVNTVRQTGGSNASRILVVQGPNTDIDKSTELSSVLPDDTTADALMFEIHFYAPYQFVMMMENADWSYMFYYWGSKNHVSGSNYNATWGEDSYVLQQMRKMRTKYSSKGIPVIMGEYGSTWRVMPTGENQAKHNSSIHDWYYSVCRNAKNNGIVPMVWDTNSCKQPTGTIVDRSKCAVYDQYAYEGIMDGVASATWPFASDIKDRFEEEDAFVGGQAYSLTGIPVGSNYRGIVIVNGKKILK